MKAINDGVRFVLELCALAAIGYWGWRTGNSAASKLVLTMRGIVVVAAVWGIVRAESDAIVEVPTAVRVVIEIAVFATATAALAAVGRTRFAVPFAVIAARHRRGAAKVELIGREPGGRSRRARALPAPA